MITASASRSSSSQAATRGSKRAMRRATPPASRGGDGLRQLTKALLERAPTRARTRNGETALHLAALHPEPEFADLLLAAGARPGARNADGDSPLHWAALSGISWWCSVCSHAEPIRAKNRKGLSAATTRRDGHDEVVRLLDRVSK